MLLIKKASQDVFEKKNAHLILELFDFELEANCNFVFIAFQQQKKGEVKLTL